MPLLAIDQRLVERFEHVGLDFREAEAAHMRHDALDEPRARGVGDDPIEKVALDRAVDPGARQRFARQQPCRIVLIDA